MIRASHHNPSMASQVVQPTSQPTLKRRLDGNLRQQLRLKATYKMVKVDELLFIRGQKWPANRTSDDPSASDVAFRSSALATDSSWSTAGR